MRRGKHRATGRKHQAVAVTWTLTWPVAAALAGVLCVALTLTFGGTLLVSGVVGGLGWLFTIALGHVASAEVDERWVGE